MKENLIKSLIIFGGGFGVFLIAKKMIENKVVGATSSGSATTKASADGSPAPDMKNAEIVADAYSGALKAGESAQRLTELNKELMKEFGMRCYVSDSNVLTVCDAKGNTITTR